MNCEKVLLAASLKHDVLLNVMRSASLKEYFSMEVLLGLDRAC